MNWGPPSFPVTRIVSYVSNSCAICNLDVYRVAQESRVPSAVRLAWVEFLDVRLSLMATFSDIQQVTLDISSFPGRLFELKYTASLTVHESDRVFIDGLSLGGTLGL